jgi:acyl-CoA dehydrogenase
MDFEYSGKTKDLLKRVDAFMDEWIYPNEHKFYEEVGTDDRWQPTKIIEYLKVEAR